MNFLNVIHTTLGFITMLGLGRRFTFIVLTFNSWNFIEILYPDAEDFTVCVTWYQFNLEIFLRDIEVEDYG